MKRYGEHKHATGGFTLVEVTVTLVILALLSAIVVPAMTGWLDKGSEKSVTTACGTCVFVTQTLINENLDENGVNTTAVPETATILDLAGLSSKGAVSNVTVKLPATLDTLTYTENASGIAVTYYSSPQPHYEVGTGAADANTALNEIYQAYKKVMDGTLITGKTYSGQVDSIAIDSGNVNTPYAKAMYDTFPRATQLYLADKSWFIVRNGTEGARLYFTMEKYDKSNSGEENIVVYKYDPLAQQYQYSQQGKIDKDGKINANNGWKDAVWFSTLEEATADLEKKKK